jgi:hypothetical protein
MMLFEMLQFVISDMSGSRHYWALWKCSASIRTTCAHLICTNPGLSSNTITAAEITKLCSSQVEIPTDVSCLILQLENLKTLLDFLLGPISAPAPATRDLCNDMLTNQHCYERLAKADPRMDDNITLHEFLRVCCVTGIVSPVVYGDFNF